jgi:hypothetical protein
LTIGIYTYVFLEVRKQGMVMKRLTDDECPGSHQTGESKQIKVAETMYQSSQYNYGNSTTAHGIPAASQSPMSGPPSSEGTFPMGRSLLAAENTELKPSLQSFGSVSSAPQSQKSSPNGVAANTRKIQKLLLLNAYPIAYVVLWIPGILNRIVEATGHKSRTLAIMQASTQYIGLANAITYGYNEQIKRQLAKRFRKDAEP